MVRVQHHALRIREMKTHQSDAKFVIDEYQDSFVATLDTSILIGGHIFLSVIRNQEELTNFVQTTGNADYGRKLLSDTFALKP